jgi:hypothetical protein
MLVDFGLGVLRGSGLFSKIDPKLPIVQNDLWSVSARLASGKNLFSGSVTLNGLGSGPLRGAFFGPAANEVGGAFSFAGGGSATAGAFTGWRNTAVFGDNTTFYGSTAPRFYLANGASISATIPPGTVISNGPIIVKNPVAGSPAFVVLREQSSDDTFFFADGTSRTYFGGGNFLTDTEWEGLDTLVKGGGLYSVDAATNTVHYDAILYGVATPPSQLPRTGFGFYRTKLTGGLVSDGKAYSLLTGSGTLTADFGGGAITTSGQWRQLDALPNGVDSSQAAVLDQGTWQGKGTFASANRSFSGTIRLDGATDYNGSFDGRLFGKGLASIGATLALTGTGGVRGAAAFVGQGDPFMSASFSPLDSSLDTAPMSSRLKGLGYALAADGSVTKRYALGDFSGNWPQDVGIGYSGGKKPNVALYTVGSQTALLKPSRIVASASDAGHVVYAFPNVNDGQHTYRKATLTRYVFDGLDGRIKLTYTDLAAIAGQDKTSGARTIAASYLAYGNATPYDQRPTTGKARYDGVLIGRGLVTRGAATNAYDLTGAARVAADFSAGTVTTTLTVAGQNLAGGGTVQFGQFAMPGTVAGIGTIGQTVGFFGAATKPNWSGHAVCLFYGPAAQEAAGSFQIDLANLSGSTGTLQGAFATRKP